MYQLVWIIVFWFIQTNILIFVVFYRNICAYLNILDKIFFYYTLM